MSKTLKMARGDLYINPNTGFSETVEGPQKASQDLAEILLTPSKPSYESRAFVAFRKYTPYGFDLATIQVPYLYSGVLGKGIVTKKVAEAVNRLQSMQRSDLHSTDDERIDAIDDIDVTQLSANDFYFLLKVKLESAAVVAADILPVDLTHQMPKRNFGTLGTP
jgi:hypothetical protein